MTTGCLACAARIRALEEELRCWREAGQKSLSDGDGLDRLARYSRRLGLSPRNVKVLLAFVDHPDKVRTREGLLEMTLGFDGPDDDRSDRAVDTRVKLLRQALRRAFPQGASGVVIETLYGVGYVMSRGVADAIRREVEA